MSRSKSAKKQQRGERRRAIQAALGQLGWHAKPRDVVALLANCGIDVGEGMVQRVRMRVNKFWSDARIRQQASRLRGYRPVHAHVHKTPAPRSHAR